MASCSLFVAKSVNDGAYCDMTGCAVVLPSVEWMDGKDACLFVGESEFGDLHA